VRPEGNLGYLNGCRYALDALRASTGRTYAWVVVTNTDVAFERAFFQKLVDVEVPGDVGIVAPAIRTEDGRVQNPFMRHRPSRFRMAAYPWLFESGLVTRFYRWMHRLRGRLRRGMLAVDDRAQRIYAPHGSVLLFRRHFFERGGTLQFGSFLYGEEIFLAETARVTGQAVWWQPDLQVVHVTRQTTEHVAAEHRRRWERESARYLYRTFFRRG
jgi:GT2 family glycosyltransferase